MSQLEHQTITASELVVRRLAQHGISQSFGVVGGAIMYITDALRRCEDISTVFTHHEQGAAIAAEAYSKLTHRPALLFATAGPGTTNVITGVADAYMDSVPMVVLIGDVRSTIAADFTRQRYNAPQEVNQAALMQPITKRYLALMPDMPSEAIVAAVDSMVYLTRSGRPGPVCLAMPLDVQGKACNLDTLSSPFAVEPTPLADPSQAAHKAMQGLLQAKRPMLLLGAGVRIAGVVQQVEELIARYSIPWCVTIGAVDLQDHQNPLSCGCVGPTSQRAANSLLQSADCVLALATSFDQSVTGFNVTDLIHNKKVYLVNVDSGENLRFNDSQIETVEYDLADFITEINKHTYPVGNHNPWLNQVLEIKSLLTPQLEASIRSTAGAQYLSAYDISAELSQQLPADATVVLGISLDAHSVFNAFQVKRGQRVIVSRNLGPMGWDVPALLGAAFSGRQSQSLILVTGDGSLMLNIQELAVIANLKIPACIFLFNNDGYASIRTTQNNFFGNQFFGCNSASGLSIPPLAPLARGFGLEYQALNSLTEIGQVLQTHALEGKPRLVECRIDPGQLREPRLVSKVIDGKFQTPALHDMTPSLPTPTAQALAALTPCPETD